MFYSSTSSFVLAIRAAQPAIADGNATGAAVITVARQATNTTEQIDGESFDVAPGTNFLQNSLNTNSTGTNTNFSAWARTIVKNLSTNIPTTITVEYATVVGGFTVQLQVGSSTIQLLD
jgi:hypothetical protein